VVPWEQEAEVPWRGEMWRETFQRGAFDGIEDHAGRVRVNREHNKGDTVGRAVSLDPRASEGLIGRLKIASTPRGDDTLELAADDMLSASGGFYSKAPTDIVLNRRLMLRRVVRSFLDHIGMVETPAYVGARVLAVRAEHSGLAVADVPLPPTPVLDDFQNDDVLLWATSRIAR
jgi:HK97 family phage prohead protease